jgi:hypothetical protein
MLNMHTKKIMQFTEVFHSKFLLQGWDNPLAKTGRGGSENDVIDIEEQVGRVGTTLIDEQWSIWLGLSKPKREQVCGKATVPGAGSLLEPIQGLVEPADIVRMSGVLKTTEPLAVNSLCQGTMEKRILHIKLMNRPSPWESQGA